MSSMNTLSTLFAQCQLDFIPSFSQQVFIEHQLYTRHTTCKGKQKAKETIIVTQDFSDEDSDRWGCRDLKER